MKSMLTLPRSVSEIGPYFSRKIFGRGERIRTSGPCLPKTVLYQAELLPDRAEILRFRRGRARSIERLRLRCKRLTLSAPQCPEWCQTAYENQIGTTLSYS